MARAANDAPVPSGVNVKGSRIHTEGGSFVGGNQIQYITNNNLEIDDSDEKDPKSSTRHVPWLLPYLTDRSEQMRRLNGAVQAQLDRGLIRPVTFVAMGREDECLDRFVEQIRYQGLPAILKSNELPADIIFRAVQWPRVDRHDTNTIEIGAQHLDSIREQIHDALTIRTTANKSAIEQKLTDRQITCCFQVGLSLDDWGAAQMALLAEWLKWLNGLDLRQARSPFVFLISIAYAPGLLSRLRSQRALSTLRRDIRAIAGDQSLAGAVHVLPDLPRVSFADVDHWIKEHVENVDREVLRRNIRRHFFMIMGYGERKLSMYKTAKAVKRAMSHSGAGMGTT